MSHLAFTIGIDPGAKGAVAVLNATGDISEVRDLPYVGKSLSAPLLADIINVYPDSNAIVEQVHAMPGNGAVSMFNFGAGYGTILGVLGGARIPTFHVTPGKWKKAMGLTSVKDASRRKAIDRWPDHADLFARAKDDGRAEACLIAAWWLEQ